MKRIRLALVIGAVVLIGGLGAYLFAETKDFFYDSWVWIRTQGPMRVHHIADGDTIAVVPHIYGKSFSVRLLGINAKEIEHNGQPAECFGKQAHDYVASLAEGKIATITYDSLKEMHDDHDRLLGYVTIYDGYLPYFSRWGTDLNLDLLQKGYAEEWQYKGRYTRGDEFLAAEAKARQENVGGWKICSDFKKHPRGGSRKRGKKHVADHD